MAEATFAERLTSLAMGRDSSRATLHVGIALGVAVGTPAGTTLVATALRLPIALASSDRGVRLVPYVEPGLGTGLVHGHGLTDAGLRAMFGAGVAALGLGDGVMVHAGVHRVFMPDGNWLAGIGLTYAAPR